MHVTMGFGDLTTDAWGHPKFTQPVSLFHGMWTFDVPPSMWQVEENGSEVANSASTGATSIDGALVLNTAAGSLTSVHVVSRRHPRYQPNRGHLYSTAVILPDKGNNGVRDFGLIETNNGVFFRLKSDGLLYGVLRSGGSETEYLIDTSKLTDFDVEKGNVYDIQFQWRGVGNYKFYINLQEVLFVNNLGTLAVLSMENPALAAGFVATKTTEDVVIKVGCVDITSEGGAGSREQYGEVSTVVAGIVTGDGIFAIRSPLLAPNGEVNTRDLRLTRISLGTDKKGVFKVYQTRDATAVVAGSWSAPKTGSFVEVNTTMTSVDTAKMESFTTFRLASGQSKEKTNPSPNTIDFFGVHGDYLVVVCDSATAAAEIDASIEYGEEI